MRLLVLSLIAALGLSSCTTFDQRRGPEPILDGASVSTASSNKMIFLDALRRDANVSDIAPDWYLVSEAGFNYVDDQCHAYFDSLFFLDRGREQIKSGLIAAGQTTAAILAVTGAAAPSLAIAAQAFGFAASATDLTAGTYLYRLPPATTQGFVEKLQLAFRDAALASRTRVTSPTAAYYLIQRYLNLCLPPHIEAEITKQIASTNAFGVPTPNGALFSIETVSATPAARDADIPVLTKVDGALPKLTPARPIHLSMNRFGRTEADLSAAEIKCFQIVAGGTTLDGDLGPIDSPTRHAIVALLKKRPDGRPRDGTQLDRRDIDLLETAIDERGGSSALGCGRF